ncbi:hypothetical protein LCGC14_1594280 [marine sediment metagenome]|uniref:Uncharacterized protein n=1 Tax=marine sediment metagenome TaxID=412755 RepID=A0A0F9IZG5_9ZZZZ|nr:hypothetical protein [Candidatus Aminicenantes bacterium]
MIILPRRRRLFTGIQSWADWDEKKESGLASDDTFVCLMENLSAGGNEVGQGGGLTGADLVLTQSGNIAGLSGGRRQMDGADDFFAMTTAALDTLISNPSERWTIVVKGTDIQTDAVNNNFLASFRNAGNTENIALRVDSANKLGHLYDQDGAGQDFLLTTDAMGTTTEYYTMIWADGTEKVRLGYATLKPTKWSDFAANDRKEVANAAFTGDFSGETWDGTNHIGTGPNGAGIGCMVFKLDYVILSKLSFIDNSA